MEEPEESIEELEDDICPFCLETYLECICDDDE